MSKVRNTIFTRFVVVATLVLFMVAQHPAPLSSAEAVRAAVVVKHKPLEHFVAGHRIRVEALVADPQGMSLVRCYFRAAGQADYVFTGMKAGEKSMFTGILPSPAAETKAIEYLFLTVNGKNQVVKTQVFKTESKDTKNIPAWQSAGAEETIVVSTELAQATMPVGFNDSVTVDAVESSARFGLVAGLYSAAQATAAGGSAGAAATATSAGTVSASAGLSTTMIAGVSAAAVVVVAVGVALASGGGEGDGSDTSTSGCGQYVGTWVGSYNYRDCSGEHAGQLRMTVGSDCSAALCAGATCINSRVVGDTVSFSAQDAECGTQVLDGRFASPTSLDGTVGGVATGTWSMTKQLA